MPVRLKFESFYVFGMIMLKKKCNQLINNKSTTHKFLNSYKTGLNRKWDNNFGKKIKNTNTVTIINGVKFLKLYVYGMVKLTKFTFQVQNATRFYEKNHENFNQAISCFILNQKLIHYWIREKKTITLCITWTVGLKNHFSLSFPLKYTFKTYLLLVEFTHL